MAKGNKGQVVETGTDEDNELEATAESTKINGGDGNDIIVGGSQVDRINAGDGDDIITGGAGDDTIYGNDGHDTAVFSGSVFDYTWTPGRGNSWIVDGTDGTDTLKHIEVLSFDDFDLNLDGSNNLVFSQADTGTTDEDSSTEIDVLANDFDFDGDTLSVTAASSSMVGVTVTVNQDNTVYYDPGQVFQYLADGEEATDTINYIVDDGNGGAVTETVLVTITGENDGPAVAAAIVAGGTEDDAAFSVDLLDGASDVDASDTLSVSNLALIGGDVSGVTTNGNSLDVDPSAYNSLALGESEVITYNYDVIDGNGGSVAQTATVTIDGLNDAPVISGGTSSGNVSEDDVLTAIGSLAAADVDTSDLLTWSGGGTGTYGSLSIDGSGTWTYTLDNESATVQGLNDADIVSDLFIVEVSDGHGGTPVTETISITVTGNDEEEEEIPVFAEGTLDLDSSAIGSVNSTSGFTSSDPADSDYWFFNLTAGDSVVVQVHRLEQDLDPALFIFEGTISDPFAQLGANIPFSGSGFIGWADDEISNPGPFGDPYLTFTAPSTGTYTAIITNFLSGPNDGGDGRFDYEIFLDTFPIV